VDDEALLPALLYLHGGGWVLGDATTHDRLARELAHGARVAVVYVDYELAPESCFPHAAETAYAAARYVAENGAALGVDGSRLAVAGDGTGGNLATVVCRMARERRGPDIACQVLFCPVTDAGFDTRSFERFRDGPCLTRATMQWFWDAYLPDATARQDPAASPLRAPVEALRGLPDALVITAEIDVLRDEGEAYARKLAEAGVRVTSTRYNGTIHGFVVLNALADTPAARGAIAQAVAVLRGALE
jgi:acetyl esterase